VGDPSFRLKNGCTQDDPELYGRALTRLKYAAFQDDGLVGE
jgi:hypothetical protein